MSEPRGNQIIALNDKAREAVSLADGPDKTALAMEVVSETLALTDKWIRLGGLNR